MSLDYNDGGLHVANIELIARLFLRKATLGGYLEDDSQLLCLSITCRL